MNDYAMIDLALEALAYAAHHTEDVDKAREFHETFARLVAYYCSMGDGYIVSLGGK